jgi:hypothetical protein
MRARNIIFYLAFISSFAFISCEKFELEEHCPEGDHVEANPQDLRSFVNDDSDDEESTLQLSGSSADGSEGGITPDSTNEDGPEENNDDDGDLVNDDSDNEDEAGQPDADGKGTPPGKAK